MYFKNVSFEQLEQALVKTNEDFEGNIRWLLPPFRKNKNYISARLATISLDAPGSRWHLRSLGWDGQYKGGKRSRFACWHVHGTFFDHLFEIAPEAKVISYGNKITREQGNWVKHRLSGQHDGRDRLMFSDSCLCKVREEMKMVQDMPPEELALHLHNLKFEQSKQLLERRLKGKDGPDINLHPA